MKQQRGGSGRGGGRWKVKGHVPRSRSKGKWRHQPDRSCTSGAPLWTSHELVLSIPYSIPLHIIYSIPLNTAILLNGSCEGQIKVRREMFVKFKIAIHLPIH